MNFEIVRTVKSKDENRLGIVIYARDYRKYFSFIIPKEAFGDNRMPTTEEELNEQLKDLGFEI